MCRVRAENLRAALARELFSQKSVKKPLNRQRRRVCVML